MSSENRNFDSFFLFFCVTSLSYDTLNYSAAVLKIVEDEFFVIVIWVKLTGKR